MTTALRPDGGFDADPSGGLRPFDAHPLTAPRLPPGGVGGEGRIDRGTARSGAGR